MNVLAGSQGFSVARPTTVAALKYLAPALLMGKRTHMKSTWTDEFSPPSSPPSLKNKLRGERASSSLTTVQKPARRSRARSIMADSVFLLPALLLFTLFVIYPTISSFYYSLTDWSGVGVAHFVGLDNFIKAVSSGQILRGLQVTLLFTVAVMIVQNVLGLLLALSLNSIGRGISSILRVVFLLPMMLSFIVTGYIWKYMYSPLSGLINVFLARIGLAGWQQDWLGNPHIVLACVTVAAIWQAMGFNTIIYLAGLQAVPPELLEAASIDGASGLQRLRSVIFPLLAPAFTVSYTMTLIGGLKVFDVIFIMTAGGPGTTTQSLAFQVYNEAFNNNNYGYATALSIVMAVLISAVTLFNLTFLRKREVEL